MIVRSGQLYRRFAVAFAVLLAFAAGCQTSPKWLIHPDDERYLEWPEGVAVAQVRVARPTDQLDAVVAFYRDGLGLSVINRFTNHDGYDGVMLGLPQSQYHLEFTTHIHGSPGAAPSRDNLLVLYIPEESHYRKMVDRLLALGKEPVKPENPYWVGRSLTFEDPDGWRVVLCNTGGI